ncbi:SDR family NAD(P)-dependent oxidoreductase [Haloprofundus halobius]|uniref:SDR family NAD(P)-dependent oxidoreductase n=1 Tax=Haloprofundus halobius TaxID=2876194 RepID=UPI001CCD4FFC|nr:SDR family oxidoreductase [Haloprofundus halobius]
MVGHTEYDFSGESAIVTGSTSGIGRGIARSLIEANANVVVNSRTEKDVRETASSLDELGTGNAIGITADMSDPSAIDDLVENAIQEFGEIDLLVNNAAIWPMEGEMIEANLDNWDTTMDVNVRAQFYASKLVATHMRDEGIEGSIVNVTSQTGDRRTGNRGIYGVSNSSVNGLTWRMAGELAEHGIRMNAVSTDLADTRQVRLEAHQEGEASGRTEEEVLDEWASDLPLGRMGEPSDLADAVLFLASDRAEYVVGTILRVAGGGNLQ